MQRFPLGVRSPGPQPLRGPALPPPSLPPPESYCRSGGTAVAWRFGELSVAEQPAAQPTALVQPPHTHPLPLPFPPPGVSAPGTAKYLLESFWT